MTIYSAQSGDWSSTSTWVGGVVPNLNTDDVVIAAGHTVTIQSGSSLTLAPGRWLSVDASGTLEVAGSLQLDSGSSTSIDGGLSVASGYTLNVYGELTVNSGGWLDCYGSVYFDSGNGPTINGSLYVGVNGSLYVSNSTNLTVNGSLYVDSNGYLYLNWYANLYLNGTGTIWGYVSVEYYSYLYVHSQLTVELGAGLYSNYSACTQVESGGVLTLIGWMDVYDGATLYVASGGRMRIEREGGLGVSYYANVTVEGVMDAFGYFSLNNDAYLNVYGDGRIQAYRSLYISGQMFGGGRIEMLRREAQILDYNGNRLIVFDRAYGYAPTLIA